MKDGHKPWAGEVSGQANGIGLSLGRLYYEEAVTNAL